MMIDEDGIIVSATEPTGGNRRKVWMQKGKNIIPTDFNNWESGQYNMDDGQVEYNPARIRLNSLLKVKQGKTYYFNIFSDYMFIIRTYDKNGNFSRSIGGIENGSTITTNTDEEYLGVIIYSASSTPTFEDYKALFENGTIKPMICLNSEKNKEFEPNIKNAVHVKNDNGEYEEFLSKEESAVRVLYDGGQTLDNITLNDSVTNYDYIEIFYKLGETANVGSKKFNVTSGNFSLILDGIMFVNDFIQPFSSIITINDKTLTRVRTGGVNIKTTTNAISAWTGNVYITKVVGFKN